jgi:FkbM family methyltransferase
MSLSKNIVSIEYLNRDKEFCIYNKNAKDNLLIISACRGANFAYYFSQTTPYNIYMIYIIPFMQNPNLRLDREQISEILKNTKVVCCEEIKCTPFLNTAGNNTIFDHYNVDKQTTKIFFFPNLELRYLSYVFFHDKNKYQKTIEDYFKHSKEYLFTRMKKYNFYKSIKFIDMYFKEVQLFHTKNHPTVILSLVVFLELCEHMDITITNENINEFIKHNFLGGHEDPVFKRDIDVYGFKYKCVIHDDSLFQKENVMPILDHTHLNVESNAKLINDYYNTYSTVMPDSYSNRANLHHSYYHLEIKNKRKPIIPENLQPDWVGGSVGNFYFVCHKNDSYSGERITKGCLQETMILNLSKKYIDPEKSVIDIGANIGNHTIVYSNFTNKTVYSFEPQPEMYNILNENVKINGCDNVQTFNYAISDKNADASMNARYDRPNAFGCFSIQDSNYTAGIKIDCKTLSKSEFYNIGFIKIDVEGHELQVLKGINEILLNDKPIIFIEIHDFSDTKYETFQYLRELGYAPLLKMSHCDYIFQSSSA